AKPGACGGLVQAGAHVRIPAGRGWADALPEELPDVSRRHRRAIRGDKGKGKDMKSWGDILTEPEMAAVVKYVRTLSAEKKG
ncbi:MAG: hypothetical protein AABZ80_04450, partial [Gemmatimonadota bacterium]